MRVTRTHEHTYTHPPVRVWKIVCHMMYMFVWVCMVLRVCLCVCMHVGMHVLIYFHMLIDVAFLTLSEIV